MRKSLAYTLQMPQVHLGGGVEVRPCIFGCLCPVQNLNKEERQDMADEALMTHGVEQQKATAQPTRRAFLTRTGQTGLALLLAGLPCGWVGAVYASEAPETPNIRIGMIALTDCSSIVMAYELGLF